MFCKKFVIFVNMLNEFRQLSQIFKQEIIELDKTAFFFCAQIAKSLRMISGLCIALRIKHQI